MERLSQLGQLVSSNQHRQRTKNLLRSILKTKKYFGLDLEFLPEAFEKRRLNKTKVIKSSIVEWTVEFRIVTDDHGDLESCKNYKKLILQVKDTQTFQEAIQVLSMDKVYLKNDLTNADPKFIKVSTFSSLCSALQNIKIIEFPTFYIISNLPPM